ncbi:MAG: hypothetical protein PHI31_09850 [Desulfuromonadaceae bacterium]|nr:hypothetical protein [Desulfuromonadaceae bacterium]
MRDTKGFKCWMALLITIGFLACVYILIYTEIQAGSREAVLILTGALAGMVKDVFGFYFGSSESSHRKTEILQGGDNGMATQQ